MEKNILEFLENSAEKYPDKIAVRDVENSITYSELIKKAKAIGTFISRKKVRNNPVVVLIDRNIESIIMFLGVVYSGNFYVPIDTTLPSVRIKSIFETLEPLTIIGRECDFSVFESIEKEYLNFYDNIIKTPIDDEALNYICNDSIDTDPLYCIFTSGSTGVPKGVLISHRSVIDLVNAFSSVFKFRSDDIFGNQAPFDFDVSTKDIYNALKNGSTIDIIPKQFFSFPIKLVEYLNTRKITIAIWAVSALCIVAQLRTFKKIKPEYLRSILFSGEVMPIKVLNYWKEYLPDITYVNLYGPTEITCNCTYYTVDKEYYVDDKIPIGKPFINTGIIILDGDTAVTSVNTVGELCVKGTCLALGYYNNSQKTNEAFVQNPLNNMYPEIIYRTGDLVYKNNDQDLVYVGRKDFQIKHMGHRIELQEIEAAANQLNSVKACCCIYNHETQRIILIYESDTIDEKELIEVIEKTLPKFMVPNKIIRIDKMPMNNHFKIDRKLLTDMSLKGEL